MSYNPSDKPAVSQLCTGLSSVTDWQSFALELPGIEMEHVENIENDYPSTDHQKTALFHKWLNRHPSATWSDINAALVVIGEVSLATSLVNQSVPYTNSSPLSLPSSPQMPSSPLTQQAQQRVKQVMIDDEDEAGISVIKLYEKFAEIVVIVKAEFTKLVSQHPAKLQDIVSFAENIINLLQVRAVKFNVLNIEEFFGTIHPYYDFLDCEVLTLIVKKFVGQALLSALRVHSVKAGILCRTVPIKQLAKDLPKSYTDISNLPTLDIKLEALWGKVAIRGLYVLIEHLLPDAVKEHPQFSLMNNTVIDESCLQYGIRDPSLIDAIREHVKLNTDFMKLIGVLQLAINGENVMDEHESHSFLFDASLFDAVMAGNNVAVHCLIDIGANVNYQLQNKGPVVGLCLQLVVGATIDITDGATPLMGAVMVNNTGIIHRLLEAGADVHIQDGHGITALMIACSSGGDGYMEAVRLLLSNGADPAILSGNIAKGRPVSPFDIACGADNSAAVEVILTDYCMPPEAVVRGLYWALLWHAINTIKLLQSKIPNVDPLAITLGVACGEGDIETVQSVVKQGADPDISIVHGLTPLMIASHCGHIDVVDVLLLRGVDIDKRDDVSSNTARDHATDTRNFDIAERINAFKNGNSSGPFGTKSHTRGDPNRQSEVLHQSCFSCIIL